MPTPPEAVGQVIRRRRRELGFSQEQLGELAGGVDQTYLSGIENGRRNPTLDVLWRLAGALAVPLSELISAAEAELEVR